jgi:protein farnesyltransferase/geranylgeranyltransferase type-1 subunit alpha
MMQAMIPVVEIEDVFADLPGIPQDDGPDPVCSIQYPTAFVIAYDRIRAVWKKGEKSERALKLSATCLKLNPANYTVWHFRRECLQALGLTKEIIQQDLQLAASLGGDNPKNYQIWYHRRALLEMHDANMQQDVWESELDYIAEVLREDSKNYHAWSHRQWILKTANEEAAWNTEVDFGASFLFCFLERCVCLCPRCVCAYSELADTNPLFLVFFPFSLALALALYNY